jgi:hypothetical protein
VTAPVYFDGPEYKARYDRERLKDQQARIRWLMADGAWRTIREISAATGDPEASVSAQLRHLRKNRFGSFVVDREPCGDRRRGLFAYRVLPPDPDAPPREHGAESKRVIQELRARIRELEAEVSRLREVGP